jgi:hypothetical protein
MCHGVTGVATSPNFPNLAGQTEGYVVAQLIEFRSHSREDPAGFEYMRGIARRLTDAQIKDLAAYYARQTPAHQTPEGDPARIDAGRVLLTACARHPRLQQLPWRPWPGIGHIPEAGGAAQRLRRQAIAHKRRVRSTAGSRPTAGWP